MPQLEIQPNLKLFKLLGDDTRLKLLALLQKSEFTVSEIVDILSLHQSNISRHLTQLRESSLVQDRKEGTLVYYRWSERLKSSNSIKSLIQEAWRDHDDHDQLEAQVTAILEHRRNQSKSFFDRVAGQYKEIAQTGGGALGLVSALGCLVKARCAADIGCGEGELSRILSEGCQKVISVDLSQKMLDVLDNKAQEDKIININTRQGDVENLPLADNECDLLFLSQVLHHSPTPEKALREALRVIEPSGRLVILDLLSHDQEWVREKMGDLWLGFEPKNLSLLLKKIGFKILQEKIIPVEGGLPLILIFGEKQ